MQISGIQDEKAYKTAEDILIPMGEYFQIQDDFLDCYADPETLGKIGTDILDNKCSWVINTALAHVTPEQRAVLDVSICKSRDTCKVTDFVPLRTTTVERIQKAKHCAKRSF